MSYRIPRGRLAGLIWTAWSKQDCWHVAHRTELYTSDVVIDLRRYFTGFFPLQFPQQMMSIRDMPSGFIVHAFCSTDNLKEHWKAPPCRAKETRKAHQLVYPGRWQRAAVVAAGSVCWLSFSSRKDWMRVWQPPSDSVRCTDKHPINHYKHNAHRKRACSNPSIFQCRGREERNTRAKR